MENLFKWLFISVFLVGCGSAPKKQKKVYKYRVWIGGGAFAYVEDTDTFRLDTINNVPSLWLLDDKGKECYYNPDQILSIEINN